MHRGWVEIRWATGIMRLSPVLLECAVCCNNSQELAADKRIPMTFYSAYGEVASCIAYVCMSSTPLLCVEYGYRSPNSSLVTR